MNRIFPYVVLLSGLIVSGISAWYSIIGLTTIFTQAATAVIIMGVALEQAKLVGAVWLHRYFNNAAAKTIRWYLGVAVLVLILITSLGIFGILSRAHIEGQAKVGDSQVVVANLDAQIEPLKLNIERDERSLEQINKSLDSIIDKDAEKGLVAKRRLTREKNGLMSELSILQTRLSETQTQRNLKAQAADTVATELGPVKYVAQLIFGSQDNATTERAVRMLILCIIFVFDPLAVCLLVCSQIAFRVEAGSRPPKTTITPEELVESLERGQEWKFPDEPAADTKPRRFEEHPGVDAVERIENFVPPRIDRPGDNMTAGVAGPVLPPTDQQKIEVDLKKHGKKFWIPTQPPSKE